MSSLTARVARGMELLDRRCPGWESGVDEKTLDVVNPYRCVLCQVGGNFSQGLIMVGLPTFTKSHNELEEGAAVDTWKAHGLCSGEPEDLDGGLTNEWLRQLRERREFSTSVQQLVDQPARVKEDA